ncbi:MAG TPA: hypothetical protein VNI78_00890 [Vicinamibacterales bacterium]|nr:hypothetical protein [Vicinamibacterales bacterium]
MRGALIDGLASLAAIVVLVLALVAVDGRVRDQVARIARGGASMSAVAGAGAQVREIAAVVLAGVRRVSVDQAPLLLFVGAAIMLLLFMLRT